MAAKFCRKCGQKLLREGAKFCNRCGAPQAPPQANIPPPASAGAAIRSSSVFSKLPKVVVFGINGALGCLLGAILGEILLALLLPPPPPPPPKGPPTDIMFVLDVTGSMGAELDGLRRGISDFTREFSSRGLDVRVGLYAFGDDLISEAPQSLSFGDQSFTADTTAFQDKMESVHMTGGGDEPESSLDAIAEASHARARSGAKKVFILITDAPPHVPDKKIKSMAQAIKILNEQKIDQVHLVINTTNLSDYSPLQRVAPGRVFDLASVAHGSTTFTSLLSAVGDDIAGTIAGVSSHGTYTEENFWRVTWAFGLWTGLLAIGIGLSLIMGQNFYLRRPIVTPSALVIAILGGLVAGVIAGGAGQILFAKVGTIPLLGTVSRVAAWGLLGSLLGSGISRFVPNLGRKKAAMGGAIGGALGAVGFLFLSQFLGDIGGRLAGATILGLFLGVMIVLLEISVTKAWLEIHYGPGETRRINLGQEAVRIGSDREACDVFAIGVAPVALSYRVDQGQILCEETATGLKTVVQADDQRKVGHIMLSVHTDSGK